MKRIKQVVDKSRCTHGCWVPTAVGGNVYEQCFNCGLKRYRDPEKRKAAETHVLVSQSASEQQALF